MIRLKGIVVSEGLAKGEAFVVGTADVVVADTRVGRAEVDRELERLDRALVQTRKDILELKEQTRSVLGDMGEIIGTYLAFLGDETGLFGPIRRSIQDQRLEAAAAVARRFDAVADELRGLPEPLPSRVPDLVDIKRRLVSHLQGRKHGGSLDRLSRKVVLVADDLAPTQTAVLDRERVLAVATDRGGPASHTAILARHLGIPALVGLGTLVRHVKPGATLIVDGLNGEVIVDPDEETIRDFDARRRRLAQRTRHGPTVRGPVRTADGVEIALLGNIDNGEGARELRELGVSGIGLFRTEYLYLGREDAPDEELQAEHYARLVRTMAPLPVCIRTMDFGADKWDHRVGAGNEPNPFLGMRAIRLSFAHEPVFRAQLRAILRASAAGRVRMMFPMITDAAELRRAKGFVRSVMAELEREGIPFDPGIEIGAMVELPAAALTAERLLDEAEFLSLGTNDLTQYTLAVDRTNPLVATHFVPHHPAVLALIRMTADAARRASKHISACGEMAGTRTHVPILLGLGVHHLSMAASRIPEISDVVRGLEMAACVDLAERMLACSDAEASGRLLERFYEREKPRRRRR